LGDGNIKRQDEWTGSIAVGGRTFVDSVKVLLGFKAKRRNAIEGVKGYHLREEAAPYKALFRAEKNDIGSENAYFWDTNTE